MAMQQEALATSYRFRVENLHCTACEQRVRAVFADDLRIARIDVNIGERTIALHANRDGLTPELMDRLADAGFVPTPHSPAPDA